MEIEQEKKQPKLIQHTCKKCGKTINALSPGSLEYSIKAHNTTHKRTKTN